MADKKKPIVVMSTDWHLKETNIEEIKDLITQQCELSVSLGININFCLGDIFDHRTGQKEVTLTAFSDILGIFAKYKIKLVAIPGNHDKQNYEGFSSFIDPFRFHPGFMYIHHHGGIPMEEHGVHFHFLPYMKHGTWLGMFQEALEYMQPPFKDGKKHVLLTHIAVNGSRNNDGSVVECGIAVNDFKDFDLVLLGHYHDQQQVGHNVFHIPSLQQNNFGENPEKGFTVFYDDCTFETVKSKFKEYEKVKVDFNNITKEELTALTKEYTSVDKFVRFEFTGTSDKVKAINKEEFAALGIDVKIKVKEIEDTIQYADAEIKEYDKHSIIAAFSDFCEEQDKSFDQGIIHLSKKLS